MSNIPKAREMLSNAAGLLPQNHPARTQVEAALNLMLRSSPTKRVAAKSRMMTLGVACEIWRYFRDNPKASHQEIANALRVNPGRVSEVLTGTHYPEARRLSLYKLNQ